MFSIKFGTKNAQTTDSFTHRQYPLQSLHIYAKLVNNSAIIAFIILFLFEFNELPTPKRSFDLLLCDVTQAVMSRSLTDTRKQWSHPLPHGVELAHAVLAKLLRTNHVIWLLKYMDALSLSLIQIFFVIPFMSVAYNLFHF